MKTSDDPARARRRLIAVIAAAVALLILTGIGIYGLITGPADPNPPNRPNDPLPEATTPATPSAHLSPIAATDDPEAFALDVAHALFTWDTASGLMPLDYTTVLIDVSDPTGVEQAGLASDVAGYLPTREAWIDLRQYATRQHLSIEAAYVPDAWAEAVAQAQPGQLPEGATAYTIEGTRHRAGVWNGEDVTSEHSVAFTIFLACPSEDALSHEHPDEDDQPADDEHAHEEDDAPAAESPSCYVLRLSALDTPLR
ncbi:hypothetical protein ACP6NG_10975 [Brevibacterium casei]|uniref:hypothetical protein n=1 Tax=Brevibacterium casei TaxID=33889 RepID=UPI003F820D18